MCSKNAKLDLTIPVNLWFNYLYAPEKAKFCAHRGTQQRDSLHPKTGGNCRMAKKKEEYGNESIKSFAYYMTQISNTGNASGRYLWL